MINLLTTNDDSFIDKFHELIKSSNRIVIVTGFFSFDALDNISGLLSKNTKVEIFIGHLFEKQTLKKSISKNISLFLVKNPNQFMHAKFYYFETENKNYLIVGSSNFTINGFYNNFEINLFKTINKNEISIIEKYLKVIAEFSSNIHDEGVNDMINNPIQKKIYDELKYFYNIPSQALIADYEKEINEYQKILKNSIKNVKSDKWDTNQFKDKYLFEMNWAVSESKHTELWVNIKKTSSDEIFRKIDEMINEAENNVNANKDKIIELGNIQYTLGVSVLSEILHKYFIHDYPIKNKRSGWGLSLILDIGDSPEHILREISYTKFIEYCDKVYIHYKEWFTARKIKLNDNYKYFYLDRFFLQIYDSDKYKEIIKIYNRGKKDNGYY